MLPLAHEKSLHRTGSIYSPNLSPRESLSPYDAPRAFPVKESAKLNAAQALRRSWGWKRVFGATLLLGILLGGYGGVRWRSEEPTARGLGESKIEQFDIAGWANRDDMIIADRFGELPHDPLPEVEEIDFFENKEIVVGSPEVAQDKETAIFDPLLAIKFDAPQNSFFDQLREEVSYITTMSWGGHANQFLAIINLLHLARLTGRTAIIPTLSELHFDGDPTPLSAFYDLPKLYSATRIPFVELSAIKNYGWDIPLEVPEETMGCWSTLFASTGGINWNDGSMKAHLINVESFPVSGLRFAYQSYLDHDSLAEFDAKSAEEQREALQLSRSDISIAMVDGFSRHSSPAPEQQILCLDSTFFFGTTNNLQKVREEHHLPGEVEWEVPRDYEGDAWREVGRFVRFSEEIDELAEAYLVDLFGVEGPEEIPPFVSIHIRRTDFAQARGLVALESYTAALDRALSRLQARIDDPSSWRGPSSHLTKYHDSLPASSYAVVVTTDEEMDSEFVQELRRIGWKVVDQVKMKTEENFGGWYPGIIDAAILAKGSAFVGTEWSTFSFLAGLRVKWWNGGLEEYADLQWAR